MLDLFFEVLLSNFELFHIFFVNVNFFFKSLNFIDFLVDVVIKFLELKFKIMIFLIKTTNLFLHLF